MLPKLLLHCVCTLPATLALPGGTVYLLPSCLNGLFGLIHDLLVGAAVEMETSVKTAFESTTPTEIGPDISRISQGAPFPVSRMRLRRTFYECRVSMTKLVAPSVVLGLIS